MKFQLKPDNRNASDEDLLEDLLRTANQLGLQSIKSREYDKIGRFHSGTITKRFHGWNAALEKASLNPGRQCNISEEELISEIKRVVQEISPLKLTQKNYNKRGNYTAETIRSRFGGWNRILDELKLETNCHFEITEKDLFDNLKAVWINLGRAPGRRDMIKPLSRYSQSPYMNSYGSWRKTLEAFVEYINTGSDESPESEENIELTFVKETEKETFRHMTKRDISDRLKVCVLIRDGNKCKLCGVTVIGGNIHFDHIKPWSKGGETVVENLQVLCANHNLAKGDFYEEN
jgi:hypothetical protein